MCPGIDINMGCPDKAVVKNDACSALIKPANRPLAAEIIAATKEGAANLPVSVKTRLGFGDIDLSWHEFLLGQDLACLSVHGRTVAEKSKVPAHWPEIGQVKALAARLSPQTKVIGNGDIGSREEALRLCETYDLDGAMIGRAIFEDPFLFAERSPWPAMVAEDKIKLYLRHLETFAGTYAGSERNFEPLKKFMKVYLSGFQHAQNLRLRIAASRSAGEAIAVLKAAL